MKYTVITEEYASNLLVPTRMFTTHEADYVDIKENALWLYEGINIVAIYPAGNWKKVVREE